MKLVLLRPAMKHADLIFPDGPRLSIPLGLLYLGGVFQKDPQVQVTILDAFAHPDLATLEHAEPPFLFGWNTAQIVEHLAELEPDMVGISSTAIPFFENTVALVQAIKLRWPSLFVFAGGGDATARSDQYFQKAPLLDAIIQGEAEESLRELVQSHIAGQSWQQIPSLCYVQDQKFVQNPRRPFCRNLDALRPDFSLIDMEHYFQLGRVGFLSRVSFQYPKSYRAIHLVTSRGCPYNCSFCSIHLHMGRVYRSHSAEYILQLLQELKDTYDIRHVYFEDDHLLMQKSELSKLLQGMIDRKLNLTWSTPNGVRADGISMELAALMKASGCLYLVLGVESGSQETLQKVHKNLDLQKLETSIQACRANALDAFGFYIFGFPHEKIADIQNTLNFSIRLYQKYRFVPFIHLFKPLWGTDLYKEIEQNQRHYLIDATKIFGPRDFKIPHFLFGPKMIETENFKLADLAKFYRKYMMQIALRSFWYWFVAVGRRPKVLLHHLAVLLRDLLRHPLKMDKVLLIYFWHVWIYPNSCLSQYSKGVATHLCDFLKPARALAGK